MTIDDAGCFVFSFAVSTAFRAVWLTLIFLFVRVRLRRVVRSLGVLWGRSKDFRWPRDRRRHLSAVRPAPEPVWVHKTMEPFHR